LPKASNEEKASRDEAVRVATLRAAQVPLEVSRKALAVLKLSAEAAELGNLNAISDAGSASTLARAGLTGAGYNVRINLQGMPDDPESVKMINELTAIEKQADEMILHMKSTLTERGGMSL
jgi:formiminotetrahydrofolate cyclodeaminase